MSPEPQTFKSSIDPKRIHDAFPSGLQVSPPKTDLIITAGGLATPSTSAAKQLWHEAYLQSSESTSSGPAEFSSPSTQQSAEITRRAIAELRRISGLTWDQLGQLFEVSRRSVHFWASGKPLNAANEERLLRILDIVRQFDRGDARSTRSALFEIVDNSSAFDLLASQRFEEASARRGPESVRIKRQQIELGDAAKAARKPLPPADLVDALQGRVHRSPGRGRAARTVRNKRRGGE